MTAAKRTHLPIEQRRAQLVAAAMRVMQRDGAWTLTTRAVAREAEATTVAVGSPRAISRARLGPETTANRSGLRPSSSAQTCDIRASVPRSRPLTRETTTASGARSARTVRSVSRTCCAGTATTTTPAPRTASAASVTARTQVGRVMPGRYSGFSCRSVMASATSARRDHITISDARADSGLVLSPRTRAKADPQLPAPRTATVRGSLMPRSPALRSWDPSGPPGPVLRAARRPGR